MMKIVLKRKEISPLIYCALITVYYTLKGWKYSNDVLEVLLMLAIICGLFNATQFIMHQWEKLFLVLLFFILTIYKLLLGADTRMMVSMIAILVGMSVDFDKLARWMLTTKFITFLIAFFIGGYTHVNYVAMNMGIIISLILYIYFPKNKWNTFLVIMFMYLLTIYITRSGSIILCIGIGIFLYAISNTKLGKKILTLKFMIFLFPIILFLNWFLVELYLAYIYKNPNFYFIKNFIPNALSPKIYLLLNALNVGLSGRIELAAFSFKKFGFSLWGGNINYSVDTGLPYFLIDSGMILLLQDWGLIMSVAVMALFVFFMYKVVKEKEYRLIISAIIISLWAFNEDTLLSAGMNYLFFAIGNELYKSRNIISKKYRKQVKRYKKKICM